MCGFGLDLVFWIAVFVWVGSCVAGVLCFVLWCLILIDVGVAFLGVVSILDFLFAGVFAFVYCILILRFDCIVGMSVCGFICGF